MMKKLTGILAMFTITAVVASSAQATLLFEESFDYADASALSGQGGWTGAGAVNVAAPGGTYTGLASAGNSIVAVNSGVNIDLTAAASTVFSTAGTYYYSFLVKANATPYIVTNGYGAGWKQMQVGITASPAVRLQVEDGAGQSADDADEAVTGGWDLIVVRITNDGGAGVDTFELSYNPILTAGEPTVWDKTVTRDITHTPTSVQLYTTGGSGGPLDEIRIATTFNEAIGIPEPASLALLGLGGLMMLRRRVA